MLMPPVAEWAREQQWEELLAAFAKREGGGLESKPKSEWCKAADDLGRTALLGLLGELALTSVRGLALVDVLHEHALVLEDVTLALHVQLVVQVAVNLARLAVLAEQATENTHAAHPEHLDGHTCAGATTAL